MKRKYVLFYKKFNNRKWYFSGFDGNENLLKLTAWEMFAQRVEVGSRDYEVVKQKGFKSKGVK